MTADIIARRMGLFILYVYGDRLRHAVRFGFMLTVSDADACGDDTVLLMAGDRVLLANRQSTRC